MSSESNIQNFEQLFDKALMPSFTKEERKLWETQLAKAFPDETPEKIQALFALTKPGTRETYKTCRKYFKSHSLITPNEKSLWLAKLLFSPDVKWSCNEKQIKKIIKNFVASSFAVRKAEVGLIPLASRITLNPTFSLETQEFYHQHRILAALEHGYCTEALQSLSAFMEIRRKLPSCLEIDLGALSPIVQTFSHVLPQDLLSGLAGLDSENQKQLRALFGHWSRTYYERFLEQRGPQLARFNYENCSLLRADGWALPMSLDELRVLNEMIRLGITVEAYTLEDSEAKPAIEALCPNYSQCLLPACIQLYHERKSARLANPHMDHLRPLPFPTKTHAEFAQVFLTKHHEYPTGLFEVYDRILPELEPHFRKFAICLMADAAIQEENQNPLIALGGGFQEVTNQKRKLYQIQARFLMRLEGITPPNDPERPVTVQDCHYYCWQILFNQEAFLAHLQEHGTLPPLHLKQLTDNQREYFDSCLASASFVLRWETFCRLLWLELPVQAEFVDKVVKAYLAHHPTLGPILPKEGNALNQLGELLFTHASELEKQYNQCADPDEREALKKKMVQFYTEIPQNCSSYPLALQAQILFTYGLGQSAEEAYQNVKTLLNKAREFQNHLLVGLSFLDPKETTQAFELLKVILNCAKTWATQARLEKLNAQMEIAEQGNKRPATPPPDETPTKIAKHNGWSE